uniref:Putative myosin class i heavy chain n=1 Tax=Rhipicephalus microplus TaxID=6941 RepID=A0A6G4ZUX6_RHIMP
MLPLRPTLKRRKSESFTSSPTGAQTPAKRSSMSPQQRALVILPLTPAQQVKEIRKLWEHINDEEEENSELRHEGSRLKEVVKRKDREIASLKERLKALQEMSSSDATCLAALHKNVEEMSAQNKLLQEQVHSFEKVRDDYDRVIRQNASLQAESEKMSVIQEECNNLREDLSKALSEKSDLCTKLASLEDLVGELRSAIDLKNKELDDMVSFYSNLEKPGSPKVLAPSPGARVSCYTELRMVELQDANNKLRQESDRLQNELEELTARLQTEGNAMRASAVQLEETNATLTADVSQLKNRCTQLNVRISGLENELQLSKTTAATLESRLSIQVSQSETLRQQLADRDQHITALEEKATASDSINQELLKSNTELNTALRLSEFEKSAQAERMREVIAEKQKQQESLTRQNSKVLALEATLANLEAKLAEVTCQLLASKEEKSKLQQVVTTLHSQLETTRSQCAELEQQLNKLSMRRRPSLLSS